MSSVSHQSRSAEIERSAAVHSCDLHDPPLEQNFDDPARTAPDISGTPIAVVNLVDTHRRSFEAEVGMASRHRFGTRLIKRIVASYFDGTGRLTFASAGVRFDLTGSLTTPDARPPLEPSVRAA